MLILYTDGISDALNDDFQEFTVARLEETMRAQLTDEPDISAAGLRAAIVREVRGFAGNMVQYDDMTMLIIKRGETSGQGEGEDPIPDRR